jgi:hypothetical protein
LIQLREEQNKWLYNYQIKVSFTLITSINVRLPRVTNFMFITAIGGLHATVVDVVGGLYLQALLPLNLKYYPAEALEVHQVVTMTTELVDRVETMP